MSLARAQPPQLSDRDPAPLAASLANGTYEVLTITGPAGQDKAALACTVGHLVWATGAVPGGAVMVDLRGVAAREVRDRLGALH